MSTRAARAASAFLLLSIALSPELSARDRPDFATQYHAHDVVICLFD